METIRYSLIGKADIQFGTGSFEVTLADGRRVLIPEVDLASLISDLTKNSFSITGRTFNIEDPAYGASTGSADNAGAIQRAIDAANAAGGGTVLVPAGTWLIRTALIGKSNVRFIGVGRGLSTIKQGVAANLSSLLKFTTQSVIIVENITFDGDQANNTTRGDGLLAFTDCTDVIVRHAEFANNKGGSPTVGVALSFGGDNARVLIDGNYLHDAGSSAEPSDGIYYGGSDARIVNNLILRCTDTGIVNEARSVSASEPSDHVVIAHNTIRGISQGIAVDAAIASSVGAGCVVVGNTVEATVATNGAGIYVFKGASGTSQRAVVVANNNIRDLVDGHGIFLENVQDITVCGNICADVSPTQSKHGITVKDSDRIIVLGNLVRGAGGNGLSIQGATDCVITGNLCRGNSALAGGTTGVGIDIRASGATQSERITVTGNVCSGSPQTYGIQLANVSTDILIEGNVLKGNVTGAVNNGSTGTVRFGFNQGFGAAGALAASATYDPVNIADGAVTSTTITVPGAVIGDPVIASQDQFASNDVLVSAHVASADTVRVVLMNKTGAPLDLASGTLRVVVFKV